ncbi:iron-containing alcohol dehydrogenase [Marinicrinis sediminis]|uniref:Iron-containing alcohol dehydrogenase n=1 Tax=Marinicrinis sediminis TaxID=1652465 RepID=A0ABW5RAU9_9BACL
MSMSFKYELPTKIEFGHHVIQKLPEHVHALGGSRALIVTDPGLIEAGIVDQAVQPLLDAQIPFDIFSEIEPDPDIEGVPKAVQAAQKAGCDIVIGLGGGSSLDTAKAAGIMLGNDGDIRDYVGINKVPHRGAPVIAVPTTAGTGSEVTIWSVLTDKQSGAKLSVGSPHNCPALALCDPMLTLTLPPHITAATGMDALTHALESYVNKATQPISEGMSLQAMTLIARSLRTAVFHGKDVQARYDMLLASLIAALAFNETRLGIAHALALPLGAHFHIPHGTVNAMLLPEVMEFNYPSQIEKFKRIAEIFGERVAEVSDREAAYRSVAAIRQLKEDVGITQSLTSYGVQEEHLDRIAEEAMQSGNIPVNPRMPTPEDLKQICRKLMTPS